MKNLSLTEVQYVVGGLNVNVDKQHFDNMDVALTFAGFVSPLIVNNITLKQPGVRETGISFVNFFWSPVAATLGLVFSRVLKKFDSII